MTTKKTIARLLAASFIAGCALSVNAIPAKPGYFKFTQPDGTTVNVQKIGDEFCHYYETEDAMPLLCGVDGFLRYATLDDNGMLKLSEITAQNPALRNNAAKALSGSIDRDAVVEAIYNRNAEVNRMKLPPQSGMGTINSTFPNKGEVKVLVILVEYKDVKFSTADPAQYFSDLLNKEGFSEYNGTGSTRDYFRCQSKDQFIPEFDVFGPVTLSNNRSYYGGNDRYGNDTNPEKMAIEACKALDETVDFSQYDLDNDSFVDNIFVVYAGEGEASYGPVDSVLPHAWNIYRGSGVLYRFDGKILDSYACMNAIENGTPAGIGTFVHEFSHVIGLPDLYNTRASITDSAVYTPGTYSTMDQGSYNNNGRTPPNYSIYERNAMGWIDPIVLDGPASITLESLEKSNNGCIIPTKKNTEFFLLENRQKEGWDKYLPGHGMLVWHVDYVKNPFTTNTVNTDKKHQYVDIIEAGSMANNASSATLGTYTFPGTRKKKELTATTTPALKTWAGEGLTEVPLTNITEADNIITFDVAGGSENSGVINVKTDANSLFIDGLNITWQGQAYSTITIYNIAGMAVANMTAGNDGIATLQVHTPGTYIISTPEGARKVILSE